MKERFKTKIDRNGNAYCLTVDHEKKTYTDNNFLGYDNVIVVTKKERRQLAERLQAAGYEYLF